MTLNDISRICGVSASTVSRVLSDKDTKAASKETKERIWEVVRREGYVPNSNAQKLRMRKSAYKTTINNDKKYFACVYARSQDKKDTFFSELAASIEYEAYKRNYILKYSFYANDMIEKTFADALGSKEISGIIVLGRFENERINEIAEKKRNVVYVALNQATVKHDMVFCNGYKAAELAMETLFDFGHRVIAYIGETNRENRYTAYQKSLSNHDIRVNHRLTVNTKQTLDSSYNAACQLINRAEPFSAIFCANDETAIGTIKALQDNGFMVPEDISVISIDDIEMARYFTPMLTTVHIPINELGKQAVKSLIDRIENGHTLPMKIELPFSLSLRNSCGPVSASAQKRLNKKKEVKK